MDEELKIKLARLVEAASSDELSQTFAAAMRDESMQEGKRMKDDDTQSSLKKKKKFEILHKHLEIIDLHGYTVSEARTIVGQKAHQVAQSDDIICVGFIHGMGWHSFYDDDSSFEFGNPPLKTMVTDVLSRLAKKFDCKCINGARMSFLSGAFGPSNEGITYFMNKRYYDIL